MTLSEAPVPRARENTPAWMEAAPVTSFAPTRRGVVAKRDSGTSTLVFFGLIVVGVVAAGLLAIAIWGPEKPIANRSHHATEPAAPIVMPSLPDESAGATASASASVVVESPPPPAPTESVAPTSAPLKKAKRTVAAPKSKHR